MNLLISIDEETYRHAQNRSEDSNDEWNAMRAIANGTPITDNIEPCEDAISRKDAINAIDKWISEYKPQHYLIQSIRELPSVTIRQTEYYPPCKDCNKKMDEIRRAYDKISER